MATKKRKKDTGISIIIGINSFAFVLTAAFWLLVWNRMTQASFVEVFIDKGSRASTLGFMIADIAWALPLLLLSVLGLNRKKLWGWTAAQLVNVLWVYSVTAVMVRDVYLESVSPGSLLFLPFALLAVWQAWYLWKKRKLFVG
jgi:hypothetical protein